jgi:thymidine kinase
MNIINSLNNSIFDKNILNNNNINMNKINNTPQILKDVGYLQLIIGPMFSGKTSSIINLQNQYKFSKMNVCVINYAEDKRYDENKLSTHDKVMIECFNTLQLQNILHIDFINKFDVFLINEGQFFNDLFNQVKLLVEKHNKIVHVCGLDGDFKRNGFQQITQLIPIADSIEKKQSICMNCENGTKALFSHRISNETQVKVIGASNYIPLCRFCYLKKNNFITK